jgi:hypothetical protein
MLKIRSPILYRHAPQQTEKSGAKFKILKFSKQTQSPFPQQSTLYTRFQHHPKTEEGSRSVLGGVNNIGLDIAAAARPRLLDVVVSALITGRQPYAYMAVGSTLRWGTPKTPGWGGQNPLLLQFC